MIAEVSAGLAVSATLLGETPFCFETVLRDIESDRPSFLSLHQIILLSPVKLVAEDRLWMGTVLTCQKEGDQWRATIRVEHVLRNLPELAKLAARFA